GVIKREVTRLVTTGTLTEEEMLDGREENFLACLVGGGGNAKRETRNAKLETQNTKLETRNTKSTDASESEGGGMAAAIAWCELSTGKFLTFTGTLVACGGELARIRPGE